MATLLLMCGLPFSGKTTLSKQISEILNIKRISFDEVWAESEKVMGKIPGNDSITQWKYIMTECENQIKNELKNNKNVIYDNLRSTKDQREKARNLTKSINANIKIIYIDISKEDVIKRREENLNTKTRHQVNDTNFNNALNIFETPIDEQNIILYNPKQEIKLLVDKLIANAD